jgi:putative endonuclease
MFYVYVLCSRKNKKRYIGFTSKDPNIRLEEHNRGTTAFTRSNRPFFLLYSELHDNESFARKRERYFKTGHGREYLKKIHGL